MPKARFIHDGDAIDHTPATDISAGDVVIQNDLVGIAKLDIPAGALGALAVKGVFDVAKAAGTAINAGVNIYWHTATQIANTTSSGGKLMGKSIHAAAESDTTVRVRLAQ